MRRWQRKREREMDGCEGADQTGGNVGEMKNKAQVFGEQREFEGVGCKEE